MNIVSIYLIPVFNFLNAKNSHLKVLTASVIKVQNSSRTETHLFVTDCVVCSSQDNFISFRFLADLVKVSWL